MTPSSSVENHLLLATVLSVLKPPSTTSVNPLYMCISSGQPLYNLFRRAIVYLYINRCVSLQNNHCVSLYINRCVSRQINHCIHLPKNIVCLVRSTIAHPFQINHCMPLQKNHGNSITLQPSHCLEPPFLFPTNILLSIVLVYLMACMYEL